MKSQEQNLQQLRAKLGHPDLIEQLEAAYTLAKHGNFEGRPVFLAAINDDDPDIRLEAAEKVGMIGASWAIESLGNLLCDEDSSVRNEAILALQNIGRPPVVPWLIKGLEDEDKERREDARVALVLVLGDEIISYLSQFGEDDEEEAQRVYEWWQSVSGRFNSELFYYKGKAHSLENWIAELRTASAAEIEWIAQRLHFWTGVEFVFASSSKLANSWKAWWQKNASFYETGHRYFYGHQVNDE